jgi:hypothetical protein
MCVILGKLYVETLQTTSPEDQKRTKLCTDWLWLSFQGLYIKVESKGFLLMYWKLIAMVPYSKSHSLLGVWWDVFASVLVLLLVNQSNLRPTDRIEKWFFVVRHSRNVSRKRNSEFGVSRKRNFAEVRFGSMFQNENS